MGDLTKRKDLLNLFTQFTFDIVFHCATASPLSTNASLVHAVNVRNDD